MNAKENLHEQADLLVKELSSHLRKIVESLEIGNGCEEAECLVINTSTRCFLQTCEDLLEFINQLKLKAIIGGPLSNEGQAKKEAKILVVDIKRYLTNLDEST